MDGEHQEEVVREAVPGSMMAVGMDTVVVAYAVGVHTKAGLRALDMVVTGLPEWEDN